MGEPQMENMPILVSTAFNDLAPIHQNKRKDHPFHTLNTKIQLRKNENLWLDHGQSADVQNRTGLTIESRADEEAEKRAPMASVKALERTPMQKPVEVCIG